MKKHIIRVAVYLAVVAVILSPFLIPFYRQCIFGPKIGGVPFCAWQDDFRMQWRTRTRPTTIWEKAFDGFYDGGGRRYAFPHRDPEMLPVLLSLADDSDDNVRYGVAFYLGFMPPDQEVIAALDRLGMDSMPRVRGIAEESREGLLRQKKAN